MKNWESPIFVHKQIQINTRALVLRVEVLKVLREFHTCKRLMIPVSMKVNLKHSHFLIYVYKEKK